MDIIEMLKITLLIVTTVTIPSFLISFPFVIFTRRREIFEFIKKEWELKLDKYIAWGIFIATALFILCNLAFKIWKLIQDFSYKIGELCGFEIGKKFFENNHEVFLSLIETVYQNMAVLIIVLFILLTIKKVEKK